MNPPIVKHRAKFGNTPFIAIENRTPNPIFNPIRAKSLMIDFSAPLMVTAILVMLVWLYKNSDIAKR